jgi:outer membrane protein OmpA-like peptidoglycan-associated protein
MITRKVQAALSAMMLLLALGATGCLATHKYVQSQAVQPLGVKIQDVDKKVDTKTAELDTRVTDLDHKTESEIADAQRQADAADKAAQGADQEAVAAHQTADKGVNMASNAQNQIENIDNYQEVKAATVLFAFNRAQLTDDDKQQLDSLAQTFLSMKHYAIEVKGFTDKVGSPDYNLELSRRRADTVVRYLTENGKVPLVKIHMLGFGEDLPASDNGSRDGRKQNRRVEIRVMAPQLAQGGAPDQPTASAPPPAQ